MVAFANGFSLTSLAQQNRSFHNGTIFCGAFSIAKSLVGSFSLYFLFVARADMYRIAFSDRIELMLVLILDRCPRAVGQTNFGNFSFEISLQLGERPKFAIYFN